MSTKLKKLAVTLTILMLILSFASADMKVVFSSVNGGKIDLFTQKKPYDGKGSNKPSDAFSPQEIVILYTLVTYNENPIQNLLVAFDVKAPNNASFCLTSRTNSSGIAVVNFTILTPPISIDEGEVFGKWVVLANVLLDGIIFQDSLTFRVDWIVKLISVRTIDENLTCRTDFGIGGDVGVEITLRSIAMTIKNATLAIVIQDELMVPVSFFMIRDFEVQPNEKLIFLYCKLYLPKWAFVGLANIFISALTAPVSESGVAYCPSVSTSFSITPYEPLTIALHDVAVVNAVPSPTSVELGQPVSVSVAVRNEGTEIESFNVSAYFDDVPIGTLEVAALLPYTKLTLNFTLDTSLFAPGNYTMTASIPHLVNEADLTDNVFVDGVIEVKPKPPVVIHDIAIVDVEVSNNSLYIGELLQINVSIVNKGTETETFDVGVYYDFSLIESLRVYAFAPDTQTALIFVWNTSSVSEGLYRISASAPIPNDINISDNTFINGVVQVKAKPPPIVKQYYLTVRTDPPNIILISGEGWYNETTNVTLVAPEYISVSIGIRYGFSYWDVDGTSQGLGIYEIIVQMNANHTAIAHYVMQHLVTFDQTGLDSSATGTVVTINGEPKTFRGLPYSLWVDNSTVIAYSYSITIASDISGKIFSLTNVIGPASPILVSENVTIIGNYKTQYYLTVISSYGATGGEGWYDSGTTAYATLDIGIVGHENRTRRVFTSWGNDASGTNYTRSSPILMNGPKTAVANWKTQYYLTVRTDPLGIAAVTGEGWHDESSNVTLNAPAVSGYNFGYWDVNGVSRDSGVNSITVYMNAPQTATAHYTRMSYNLTIIAMAGGTTDPAPGTYNYTAGSTVEVTAVSKLNYVFDHWELDNVNVGSANPYFVHMDGDHTLRAVFSPSVAGWFVPDWFYWLLLLLLLLLIVLLITWFYRRKRRKRAEEAFYSGWTAWYYCYDLRSRTYTI
jgi:hypothetical protein